MVQTYPESHPVADSNNGPGFEQHPPLLLTSASTERRDNRDGHIHKVPLPQKHRIDRNHGTFVRLHAEAYPLRDAPLVIDTSEAFVRIFTLSHHGNRVILVGRTDLVRGRG